MKIVITGASGFVGRNLVPILSHRAELLLVGRNVGLLKRLFPEQASCNYHDLVEYGRDADVLIHLAAINSEARVTDDVFREVNVDHLIRTYAAAGQARIRQFVNVSSIHALDLSNRSPYAESKRAGAEALRHITDGPSKVTVFLATVYAAKFGGKLSSLNQLPRSIAKLVFSILAPIKPTLHISRLACFLLDTSIEKNYKVLSDEQRGHVLYHIIRRFADLILSLTFLLVGWWAFAMIWSFVRLQSSGPGIFAQPRVGLNGTVFTCYKFRTMRLGTAEDVTNRISSTQVTRLGALLRKTKLDELPQIWNVLRNEMSLIGPRPCLPMQVDLVQERRQRGVLRVKPGITGLAQINNIDMSDPKLLAEWDERYLALRSLLLDLRIALATLFGKGQGDRVRG